MKFLFNKGYLIIFLFFIISFAYGFDNFHCTGNHLASNISLIENTNRSIFLFVLLNNLAFSVVILLGAFSFNIVSFAVVVYNGYSWGLQAAISVCKMGISLTLKSVLPHLFFELAWIFLSIFLSFRISILFYQLLNDTISSQDFYDSIKGKKKLLLFIILLICIGAIIETYVTPSFLTN